MGLGDFFTVAFMMREQGNEAMRKVYIDKTENNECFAVFLKDAEVIFAGTTIYSMKRKEYNAEYKRYADKYDINFIFDDAVPQIDFYTVPQFDIMATDSEGGYIGTIGNVTCLEEDYKIGYIDKNKKCYIIASCGKEFMDNVSNWKENLKEYDGIAFYKSKEEAQKKLEFLDISKLGN